MARTVDKSSTFEDWRQNYNSLAEDVGGIGTLRTGNNTSVVNAINFIQDQYFYFQDYEYDGSDGSNANKTFTGADNFGSVLQYTINRLLVFKNGLLLKAATDYTATNGTSVSLIVSAQNADIIRIQSFTGSYEGTLEAQQVVVYHTLTGQGNIYNNNADGGVIINGGGYSITTPTIANTNEIHGDMYFRVANKKLQFADTAKATFGNSDDLQIFHDGSDSFVKDAGQGNLRLSSNGTMVQIHDDTNDVVMARFTVGGSNELYYASALKLATDTAGINVTGDIDVSQDINLTRHLDMTDSGIIKLGASDDLQIYHNGTKSYIKDTGTGNLVIAANTLEVNNAADSENMIVANENGAVTLYHNNSSKLTTQSDGIEITGDTDTDTLTVSGNATVGGTLGVTGVATFATHVVLGDSDIIKLGDSTDLQIYHNGSNSYIDDTGTGHLYIRGGYLSFGNLAGEIYMSGAENGAVILNYDNANKLTTQADGIEVTGDVDTDTLTVSGNATISGNTILGNAASDTVTVAADVASHLIPSADSTYSLGDINNYWSHGYIDAVTTTGNATIGGNATVAGTLTVTGTSTFNGHIVIGDADTDDVSFGAELTSHIIPNANTTYDLGTSSKQWRDIYIDRIGYIDQLGTDADPTTAYIGAGEIDSTVIGGESAEIGTFTILNANTSLRTALIEFTDGDDAIVIADGGGVTANNFSSTLVNIDGGAIDGTTIGANSASTSIFTSMTATTVDINGGAIDGTTIGSNSTSSGAFTTLTASGNTTLNGNVHLGNAASDDISVNGMFATHLVPKTDDTYNLGSSIKEWNDLYIDGTANIDSLVADTADINGGSIDGATVGAASTSTGAFTTLAASGVASFADGSASAPSITNTGDTNTGILFPSADNIGFTVGGTLKAFLSGSQFNVTGNLIASGNSTIGGTLGVTGAITGTLGTAAQTNITSLGTLTTLTVDSIIINGTNIGHTSDTDAIAISSGGVVTMNQIPVFSAGINVSGGTIAGTLATAAQGSVTSLGTLTALTVDNINIDGNVISTVNSNGNLTLTPNGSGDVVISGGLVVQGTTTTLNTATLTVEDKNIELGKVGSPTDATADGGGITLRSDTGGANVGDKTILWENDTNSWDFNKAIALRGDNLDLRFYDTTGDDFYVGFKAGELSESQIWTLPTTDGTDTQLLQTDGLGNTSWTSLSIGGAGGITSEMVQDAAGTMFNGANHTGMTSAYNDGSNKVDFTLALGTSSVRGGYKIGYTESGKNYPVELSSEKMYVNVPWTDADTNDFLTGVTKSGNTLTFAVANQTDPTYEFGSNAFNSTAFTTNTGTVTGVTGTAPIASSGGTAPAISISAATLTAKGAVELATIAETNAGTDATRAVTPDGLEDWTGSNQLVGGTGITTLGTIGTGIWRGTDIEAGYVADNSISADQLFVTGDGTNGYALISDGDGSFSWAAFSGSDTTYTQEWVDSSNDVILRLNPSAGGNDDLKIVSGTGITLTPSSDDMTIDVVSASTTVAGIIELATITETNTGTATTRAVTPDGLHDWTGGSGAITKLGTIASGVWSGSIIAEAKLQNQSGTNTGDQTSVSGNAGSATQIAIGTTNASSARYVTFVSGTSGSQDLETDTSGTGLVYTPSTNTLTADIFAGRADLVNASQYDTNTTCEVLFSNNTGDGNTYVKKDSGLSYNPSTNRLATTTFAGALSGNATTATTLATSRNFSISGDITASTVAFNGSGDVVLSATIDDNTVDASALNVSGNGSTSQFLRSDGDGTMSWVTPSYTTNTDRYVNSASFNTGNGIITLTRAGSDTTQVTVDIDGRYVTTSGVTSVTGTSPIVSSGGATPAISIGNASLTAKGAVELATIAETNAGTDATRAVTPDGLEDWTGSAQVTTLGTIASGVWSGSIIAEAKLQNQSGTNTGDQSSVSGNAGTVTNGVYTTGTQTIGGAKTFSSTINVSGNNYVYATGFGRDSTDYITWTNNAYASHFVNGNEEMRLEADGDLHVDGDVVAYSSTISDRRLKTDIIDVENALDRISQLHGVEFTYKKDGRRSAGLIAQDVEKVLPQAVSEKQLPLGLGNHDKTEYKTLEYSQVTALIVEAIKELKEENKQLRNEIEDLKSSKT